MDPGAVLLGLLGSAEPRLARTRSSTSTTRRSGRTPSPGPGRGAAVLRVKGTTKALVATTDGNAAVGALDPWLGAALAVAEATRNVSITGARPLGVTNCLNYGDPTRPEAFWQLTEGVRGLADACLALGLPVTGGNVSLYNESRDRRRSPRPPRSASSGCSTTSTTLVGPAFAPTRDAILLVGEAVPGLAGSAYAALAGDRRRGRPAGARPRPRGGAPGVRPRGDRPRPRRRRPRTSRAAGSRVALAECAMWGGLGARRPDRRRPLAGRGPVRREPVAPRRDRPGRATPRRWSCWRASTACRSRPRRRSAATGW